MSSNMGDLLPHVFSIFGLWDDLTHLSVSSVGLCWVCFTPKRLYYWSARVTSNQRPIFTLITPLLTILYLLNFVFLLEKWSNTKITSKEQHRLAATYFLSLLSHPFHHSSHSRHTSLCPFLEWTKLSPNTKPLYMVFILLRVLFSPPLILANFYSSSILNNHSLKKDFPDVPTALNKEQKNVS